MKTTLASEMPVTIAQQDFDAMLSFSRAVYGLKNNAAYLAAMFADLPDAAHISTDWPSVLMGFDFHLTADGPKLIEINNNAGGLYIGEQRWLPQPAGVFSDALQQRLLAMFPSEWRNIVIMDDAVKEQYMYPEMLAYAELLRAGGRKLWVCSPDDLQLQADGLYIDGEKIDAIYNRHTDFYLDEHGLEHIRLAYQQDKVVLNPHPRSYALIGDKSRMVDWWRADLLEGCVDAAQLAQIRAVTPQTYQLAEMDADQAWAERKQWVFKPSARHGGKGVVLGKAMSRKRFAALDVSETIVQRLIPASSVDVEGRDMKLDIRLYMHGADLIAVAGRVWRGQLTNFREPGSGWVSLNIEG
ncbi:hypothetical protein JYT48_03160 [Mariprofundus ferrooxydans]|nr:hypothetical protein [Mariprofundus ferrooxydans]